MMITQDQFLWLSDGTTSRIAKYDLTGKLLTYWGTQGTSPGYMNQPHAFSVDSEGSLYIANGLNQRVEKYTPKPGADRTRLVGPQFGPSAVSAQQAAGPTFNQDVAPILYANCVSCHRPGDIAPMSLLSYESARPWARAIRARVVAREMPPWPADARYGQFRNQHRLTDAQIETIAAWADNGALQGDGAPPPAPRFVDGWTSQMDRPPDQVIEAPTAFELPPDGVIPEFTIWSTVPFGKERFIEAIELRPGNRAIVHHARVSRARLPRGVKIGKGEVWPGGPVLDGVPVTGKGTPAALPPAVSFGQPLVFYVPAGGVLRFPRGVGKRIQPDDYLMWTFHLATTGKVERGGVRIGLWFSRGDVDHEVTTWTVTEKVLVNGKDVPRDARGPQFPNIAPHEADYTVTGLMRVTEPITLYALWPHMHNRGRDMTFILQDRRGNEQTLLSVPAYRFAWQFTYELATPLKIPAGSTIKAIAHYDNSSRNRDNPAPSQEVTWGPQAENEMFDPFLEFAVDRPPTMRQRPSDLRGPDVFPPQ
jgi:hypothetical protein